LTKNHIINYSSLVLHTLARGYAGRQSRPIWNDSLGNKNIFAKRGGVLYNEVGSIKSLYYIIRGRNGFAFLGSSYSFNKKKNKKPLKVANFFFY